MAADHRQCPEGGPVGNGPFRADRGRVVHRAVGQHRPGGRRRAPGGRVPHVARHPGSEVVRQAVGGPIGGYSPTAAVRWIRRSGGAPSTSGADPIGHMLFLEHQLPRVSAAARWYLEPVDYLSMRFTGVAAASAASMAGAWLTDNRRPDPAPLRPGADPGLRGARRRSFPRCARPAAWSGRCSPPWPTTSGSSQGSR